MGATTKQKIAPLYIEMFSACRQALITACGDIETPKTFLVDFELAVIQSIQTVLPEASLKGFTFHSPQAVIRKINLIALKLV